MSRLLAITRDKRCPLLWVLLGLFFLGMPAWGAGFRILSANTQLDQGVYVLNASVKYQFSEASLEALQNGIPLTLRLRMEIWHRRDWLWDEKVAGLKQRFRLEYNTLARQYVVTNLNSGEVRSFPDRAAAIDLMSHIESFPLLDSGLLTGGEDYYVRIRAHLEIESLPVPLRPLAYLSGDWNLTSEWYAWPL